MNDHFNRLIMCWKMHNAWSTVFLIFVHSIDSLQNVLGNIAGVHMKILVNFENLADALIISYPLL